MASNSTPNPNKAPLIVPAPTGIIKLAGYSTKDFRATGYVYAPYVPLYISPNLYKNFSYSDTEYFLAVGSNVVLA